jgi:glycosyltransferase involved in cell wall biosynthesis
MKKIQFFSSVAGSAFWKRMLFEVEQCGWETEVISSLQNPSYARHKGMLPNICRRWAMYPGFIPKILNACWGSQEIAARVVTTNPFFSPCMVSKISKNVPAVNLVYDLFPDALEVAGVISSKSTYSKMLSSITKSAFANSAANVFLGERLKDYAEDRYGKSRYGVVIHVGADNTPFEQSSPSYVHDNEPVFFLYCGNMGKMHDTEILSRYFLSSKFKTITNSSKWIFHANGSGYKEMQSTVNEKSNPVLFEGGLEEDSWVKIMSSSHVALVTMKPGSEKVVMPSKTYSSLAAGQAMLAICPRNSDLADLITHYNCGWVVEPGDFQKFCEVVDIILRDRKLLHEKRVNAYIAGQNKFSMKNIALMWNDLFHHILV